MKRTRATQVLMRESFRKRLRELHPQLRRPELEVLVTRYGAKLPRGTPKRGSHLTGGAVDLTIVDSLGVELYMGTDHDDLTARARLDYFETQRRLSPIDKEAAKNRKLLRQIMSKGGFDSYRHEWWHWSSEL